MYEAVKATFSVAAVGDALITRRVYGYREPGYVGLIQRIRAADVAFANLEVVVRRDEGHPQAESGGTWVWAEPEMVKDLRWMGFQLVSVAQNHVLDWGQDGLLSTLRYVREAGLIAAGAGRSLAEARQPAYADLPGGRVALIACTTSFHIWNRAGHTRRDCQGRPGVNGIRVRRVIGVPKETYDTLAWLNRSLALDATEQLKQRLGFIKPLPEGCMYFLGHVVQEAPEPRLYEEIHPTDAEDTFRAIRDARRQADWVLVSIHCHQMSGYDIEAPPEFLRRFARACVEAGADAVLGHGPHVLRGIEIHKGKPIFYSLGNFIFQNETLPYQPSDAYEALEVPPEGSAADLFDTRSSDKHQGFVSDPRYWESVLAVIHWREGRLEKIMLYPIILGHGFPRSMRGRPLLADGARGISIIDRLRRLSEPFGVNISWSDSLGCGVIAD